jgi:hypothetical protein
MARERQEAEDKRQREVTERHRREEERRYSLYSLY